MSDEMKNKTEKLPLKHVAGIGDTNVISEEWDMNKLNDPISKKGK